MIGGRHGRPDSNSESSWATHFASRVDLGPNSIELRTTRSHTYLSANRVISAHFGCDMSNMYQKHKAE
jgi:hypothetical protein